jgi:hypothetical protein
MLCFSIMVLIDNHYSLEVSSISELSLRNLNQNVLIYGEVSEQSLFNGTMFLEISDSNSSIKAIGFEAWEYLDENTEYYFGGKLILYENELELVLKEIK